MAHTHLAGIKQLGKGVYANCGAWLEYYDYLVFDKNGLRAEKYSS